MNKYSAYVAYMIDASNELEAEKKMKAFMHMAFISLANEAEEMGINIREYDSVEMGSKISSDE